jgi:O-antigen/teichoic acid export membrane protein
VTEPSIRLVGAEARQPGPREAGSRLGGVAALLPARPHGTVLLAVSPQMHEALLPWFPAARSVDDAVAPPPSVGLLIVDARVRDVGELSALLGPDGVLATIGDGGEFVIYPDAGRPEHVWRPGWPLPDVVGPAAQLRRDLGLRGHRLRGAPRLSLRGGPYVSLADRVAADLEPLTGARPTLVGITTASKVTMRFRGAEDLAVRLLHPDQRHVEVDPQAVAEEVPRAAAHIPTELLRGHTAGHRWVATRWVGRSRPTLVQAWRRRRQGWAAAASLAQALEGTVTGHTDHGWGRRWVEATDLVPARLREELARAVAPLDRSLPTGWCHGDLWPGNVLLDRGRTVVVDWDNATRDAPLGLDWLIMAALRHAADRRATLADALVELTRAPHLLDQRVGGRRWSGWDPASRLGLAVAAFVLYLRNRAVDDIGQRSLTHQLSVMSGLVTGQRDDAVAAPPVTEREDGGGDVRPVAAVRGAVWLGIGATLTKASQTAVLLVLATVLAPSAMGTLAIGSLVLNAASSLTDLGSSTALVYWRGDAERAARSALSLAVGVSMLLLLCGWIAAPPLATLLHAGGQGAGVVRGMLVALPFSAVAGVSRELLRRDLAFVRRVAPDIVSALLTVVVSLWLAFHGHGVYALVIGQVVQSALVMVLCWLVRRPVLPGWRRSDVTGLVAYGRHLSGANIVQLLMLNVDYLIVARILGAGPLGQYSIAFRLAYMPYLLVAVVLGGAAFPYLCRLRGGAVGRGAELVYLMALAILTPLYLGMAMLAPQLELLGTQWAPAVPAVRWLSVYGLLLSVVQLGTAPLNAVSRTRDTFLAGLTHLLLLAVALLLLARHGVTAVSAGQAAVAAAAAVLTLALVRRGVDGFRMRSVVRRLGPVLAGSAAMALVILVAGALFPSSRISTAGLIAVGAAAVAAYVAGFRLCRGDRILLGLLKEGA